MTDPQPAPITCPMCQRTYEFDLEEGDWWPGAAEWWHNDQHDFLCCRRCWLQAEGYAYDDEQQRWIRPGSTSAEPTIPPSCEP